MAAMPVRVSVPAERADLIAYLRRGQETGSGASRGATRRGLGSRAFNASNDFDEIAASHCPPEAQDHANIA
jgi:hypothetical protein